MVSVDNTNNIITFIQLENEKIHSDIRNVRTELKGEIQAINVRIDATNDRITDLQSSISSYFMLATIFLTFIGILIGAIVAFAPRIWTFLERKESNVTEDKVHEIVDTAMSKKFSGLMK